MEETLVTLQNSGRKKRRSAVPYFVGNGVVRSYVEAIISGHANQQFNGKSTNPTPRGPVLRALLNALGITEHVRAREQFLDRGRHTLKGGYNRAQLLEVSRFFLKKKKSARVEGGLERKVGIEWIV